MIKYEVVNELSDVYASFDDLFDAYKSIDTDASFVPLREYTLAKLSEINTSREYNEKFANEVNNISNILAQKEDSLLDEWYVIDNDDMIYVKNDESYIAPLNYSLHSKGYNFTIRKSNEYVKYNIKHYLEENVDEFMDTVNTMIEHQMYTKYDWQRVKLTPENGLEYAENYSKSDSFNCVKYGKICSATQMEVLDLFKDDLDNIVDIIYDNATELYNYGISHELMLILR